MKSITGILPCQLRKSEVVDDTGRFRYISSMMGTRKKGTAIDFEILESWKEISQYIHKDIRTCQRWEKKLGMPIHRISGIKKSRVFAYKDDIDHWLKTHLKTSRTESLPDRSIGPIGRRVFFVCVTLLLVFVTIIALNNNHLKIVDFYIKDSTFKFINDANRVIGKFDTGMSDLETERQFKKRKQKRDEIPTLNPLPLIMFDDMDGDGSQDVLLAPVNDIRTKGKTLYFLDKTGNIKWKFSLGREIRSGQDAVVDDFCISGFCVEDLNNDKNNEILVIANHITSFLNQICILDMKGKRLKELWHVGPVNDACILDLENDGKKEIILAGKNNEQDKGFAAILHFPETSKIQMGELSFSGTQLYHEQSVVRYVLFPKNKISLFSNQPQDIRRISVRKDRERTLLVFNGESEYICNGQLELVELFYRQKIRMDYFRFKKEGLIRKSLEELIAEDMKEGVTSFENGGWVRKPAGQ